MPNTDPNEVCTTYIQANSGISPSTQLALHYLIGLLRVAPDLSDVGRVLSAAHDKRPRLDH